MCIRDRWETEEIKSFFICSAAPSSPAMSLMAVSYTHLDVYKRQIENVSAEALETHSRVYTEFKTACGA